MKNNLIQEKKIANRRGCLFYYTCQADPQKPTVVLLHGLSANHTTWRRIMPFLAEHGYSSLAPDLRGHGQSDKQKHRSWYTLPVLANDLQQIIGQEKPSEIILVGYSYGGIIALQYALNNPRGLGGLILISTNHTSPFRYHRLQFLVKPLLFIVDLLAVFFIWQKRRRYFYFDNLKARGYWQSVWIGINTMPYSVNLWLLSQTVRFDFRRSLPKLKIPVWIVKSIHDPFVTQKESQDMAKALPESKLLEIKNASHFLATRSQTEVEQIILDFLKQNTA